MKGLKTEEKFEAEAALSKYDDAKEGAEQKTVEKEADDEDPADKAGEYVQINAKEKAEKKAGEKAKEQAEKVALKKRDRVQVKLKRNKLKKKSRSGLAINASPFMNSLMVSLLPKISILR